uniref:hypothetical protein n=1 Tax=Lachnospira sp. TaxID=2049031 RepID=UPI00257BD8FB
QCLLLYPMLELTPVLFKWIPFIGCGSMLFTGITNILNKEDETIHMICAILSFILFSSWILLLKPICILPMIICGIAGKENLKWRLEIGLIISVYMTLLLII